MWDDGSKIDQIGITTQTDKWILRKWSDQFAVNTTAWIRYKLLKLSPVLHDFLQKKEAILYDTAQYEKHGFPLFFSRFIWFFQARKTQQNNDGNVLLIRLPAVRTRPGRPNRAEILWFGHFLCFYHKFAISDVFINPSDFWTNYVYLLIGLERFLRPCQENQVLC